MSVTYKKAPLVELVAELRWGAAGTLPAPEQPPALAFALPRSKDEEIYMQFAALMSAAGYGRFERVIPPGVPIPRSQIACRFRPTNPEQQAPLFQIGAAVFSANALPPYKSWADFNPLVRVGIDALLEAHRRAQSPLPEFSLALVRYIDAFSDELAGGRNVLQFLHDIMGVNLILPNVIMSKATDPAAILPLIQFALPTELGRLEMTFGEGRRGNDRAIMMDTSIAIQRAFGSGTDTVMEALTAGRLLIHDIFRGLTAPLHQAMEPT